MSPEFDERLLSPTRCARAIAFWFWYTIKLENDGVSLLDALRNYRRPYAARKRYG